MSDSDGAADQLKFGATVNYDQLWFSQSGSDLVVAIIGTNDKMTVKGWYTAGKDQLDRIEVADGDWLLTCAGLGDGNGVLDATTAGSNRADAATTAAVGAGFGGVVAPSGLSQSSGMKSAALNPPHEL